MVYNKLKSGIKVEVPFKKILWSFALSRQLASSRMEIAH